MDMQAKLRWTDGYQFVARAGGGPAVVMDSSEGKSGPTPMEMLLSTLTASWKMPIDQGKPKGYPSSAIPRTGLGHRQRCV